MAQPSTSGAREQPENCIPAELNELDLSDDHFELDYASFHPQVARSKNRLRLPKEGIANKDGYLFHHVKPAKILQNHKDRLFEYGINLKCVELFTREEDNRIRRNWTKFAEKHGLKYEDARYYAGLVDGSDLAAMVEREEETRKLKQLGMWPHLCRKLERRSAWQVQMRIILLFDPYYVGLPDPITSAEALKGYEIVSKGGSLTEAALALKRPLFTLGRNIYSKMRQLSRMGYTMDDALQQPDLLQERVMNPLRYRSLFFGVLKVLDVEERVVADEMFNSRSIEFLENLTHSFNWEILCSKFPPFNKTNLKESWSLVIANLLKAYLGIIDTDSDADEVTAWNMAVEEALPAVDVSMSVVLPYLKSLIKSYSKKAFYLKASDANEYKMAKMLHKEGLISETHKYELAYCPLFKRLQAVVNTYERFLLRHLEQSLTIGEKLKIIEMCYKYIMKSPCFDPARFMIRLPGIDRNCWVENFITFMREKYPDWKPPRVLQPYVVNPELFHLFSKKSDNKGLINAPNIVKMRKQFFGDSTCLKTIRMCGAEVALLKYMRPGREKIQEPDPTPEDVPDSDAENEATPHQRKRKYKSSNVSVSTPGWGALPLPEDEMSGIDDTVFETPVVPVKRQKKMAPLVFPNDSTIQEVNQDATLLEEEQNEEAHNQDVSFDEVGLANETVLAGCQSIMKKGSKKSRRAVRFHEDTVLPISSPEKDSDPASEGSEERDEKAHNFKHLRVENSLSKVKTVREDALPAAFSQDDFMNLFS